MYRPLTTRLSMVSGSLAKTQSASRLVALRREGSASGGVQKRYLSIHEYLSVKLLNSYDIPTPMSRAAKTADEAVQIAKSFGKPMVIKAQVLAGGRGKGHFEGGLKGGVQMVDTPEQAGKYAEQMLGHKLITKQTGAAGRICNAVMLAERREPAHEYYAAILNDRSLNGPALVASAQGGMNIEDVAKNDPSAILTHPINFEHGLSHEEALDVAKRLGFKTSETQRQAADIFVKLYKLFKDKDATQIEINPLAETKDGEVLCMDAKLGFDENAEFRQAEVFKLRDPSQEDATEVEAAAYGLNLIKLDGNIGCLVNGAGLAMATMDVLKLNGGNPANFLDVGGGATADAVKKAFQLITSDKGVKSIFVNIFGGIMRCDVIAEGIIKATDELSLDIPLIVRLQGTKEQEAKELIRKSNLKIFAFDGLDEAASRAVQAAA